MEVVPWGIPEGAAAAPAPGHPDRSLFATFTEHPFGQRRVRLSLRKVALWSSFGTQGITPQGTH